MTDSTPERWLPMAGYESLYEVSDLGRVRSLDRISRTIQGAFRRHRGRILRPRTGPRGYSHVTLYRAGPDPVRKRQTVQTVHVLVLEAFGGPRPGPTYEGRHLDGNPDNNALVNLAWGTRQENWEDRRRHGRDVYSAKTHCKRGHPFDEVNTRVKLKADGSFRGRQCKACNGRGPYR